MRYPERLNEFPKALNLLNRKAETGPRVPDSYQVLFTFYNSWLPFSQSWTTTPGLWVNKGPKKPKRQSSGRQERSAGERKQPRDDPLPSTHAICFDLTLSVFKWVLIPKYLHSPGRLSTMASFWSKKLQKLGDVQQPQMESRSWGGVGKGTPNLQTSVSPFSCTDGERAPSLSCMIKATAN